MNRRECLVWGALLLASGTANAWAFFARSGDVFNLVVMIACFASLTLCVRDFRKDGARP